VLYAQVVKQYRRKRMVGVKHRVVFGTMGAIEQVLSMSGWKINTAFVERLNLDIRQRVAAIGRRVNTLCQHEDGLQRQLAVFHVNHNFVLPHASLRQPVPVPEPTHGTGSAKLWRPCTPAMTAGVTDHVWTLREVCSIAFRRGRSLMWRKELARTMSVRQSKTGVRAIRSSGLQEVQETGFED